MGKYDVTLSFVISLSVSLSLSQSLSHSLTHGLSYGLPSTSVYLSDHYLSPSFQKTLSLSLTEK